jgi:hypothetical protein
MPVFLTSLIESGRIVDLVLLFLAGEILFLVVRGRSALAVIAAALPGAFILLALRAALTGSEPVWIAVWLAASLPAHLLDLKLRPLK